MTIQSNFHLEDESMKDDSDWVNIEENTKSRIGKGHGRRTQNAFDLDIETAKCDHK